MSHVNLCSHLQMMFRYLIIENFIPPEEKTKLMNRAVYDEDADTWMLRPLANKKWDNPFRFHSCDYL